jgi:hypothetical protein
MRGGRFFSLFVAKRLAVAAALSIGLGSLRDWLVATWHAHEIAVHVAIGLLFVPLLTVLVVAPLFNHFGIPRYRVGRDAHHRDE